MMTEAVTGLNVVDGRLLCDQMRAYFSETDIAQGAKLPQDLEALAAVREHPARQKCVLLSWDALANAIDRASDE